MYYCIVKKFLAILQKNIKNNHLNFNIKTLFVSVVVSFVSLFTYGQELIPFEENGKYGLKDVSGKVVVSAKYDLVGSFYGNLAVVRIGDDWEGKWGCINKTGKEIIPLIYDELSYSPEEQEGLIAAKLDDKWGYIDSLGKEVIPFIYERLGSFKEGKVAVMTNYKYGFIDSKGNMIVPAKYDEVRDFSKGLAVVGIGDWGEGKYGFIDKTGKEVIPLKYDEVNNFHEGWVAVRIGNDEWGVGQWRFVDTIGKEMPNEYSVAHDFSEGLASVNIGGKCFNNMFCEGGKWSFIDKTGKEVLPMQYERVASFSEGLAAVWKEGNWGFVDKKGNEVIPLKYDDVSIFSEGLAIVMLNSKWGIIDATGKEIILPKYDNIYNFKFGVVVAKLNEKWGLISLTTGEEITPFIYKEIIRLNDWTYNVYTTGDYILTGDDDDADTRLFFKINNKGECVENCENAPKDHPRIHK